MNKRIFRNLVLLWLAWVLTVIGFQALTGARFQPQWPDQLIWFPELGDPTDPKEVINYRQVGHPYMNEPFMNNQVSWDSENYIGISIGGYDDPCITVAYESVYKLGGTIVPCMDTVDRGNEQPIRLSYAFFPLLPDLDSPVCDSAQSATTQPDCHCHAGWGDHLRIGSPGSHAGVV